MPLEAPVDSETERMLSMLYLHELGLVMGTAEQPALMEHMFSFWSQAVLPVLVVGKDSKHRERTPDVEALILAQLDVILARHLAAWSPLSSEIAHRIRYVALCRLRLQLTPLWRPVNTALLVGLRFMRSFQKADFDVYHQAIGLVTTEHLGGWRMNAQAEPLTPAEFLDIMAGVQMLTVSVYLQVHNFVSRGLSEPNIMRGFHLMLQYLGNLAARCLERLSDNWPQTLVIDAIPKASASADDSSCDAFSRSNLHNWPYPTRASVNFDIHSQDPLSKGLSGVAWRRYLHLCMQRQTFFIVDFEPSTKAILRPHFQPTNSRPLGLVVHLFNVTLHQRLRIQVCLEQMPLRDWRRRHLSHGLTYRLAGLDVLDSKSLMLQLETARLWVFRRQTYLTPANFVDRCINMRLRLLSMLPLGKGIRLHEQCDLWIKAWHQGLLQAYEQPRIMAPLMLLSQMLGMAAFSNEQVALLCLLIK
jgi:hypothetical protein